MAGDSPRWVVVGRIRRAHGVGGNFKVESRTEPATALLSLCADLSYLPASALKQGENLVRDGERIRALCPISLEALGKPDGQGIFFARKKQTQKTQEAASREAAQALAGAWLLVARTRLVVPQGETLWVDLIGLTAQDRQGKILGEVLAVRDFGAGPLLEIAPPKTNARESFFIRYGKPEWCETDLAKGIIVLAPPAEFAGE